MLNPTELVIGILISVLVTGGFMILQEQATRVAYFIVRQCAAQLTRHRERRQEEWLTQIDECPRGLSQIALATSNLGAVIKDQPSIPLMFLYLFVSTIGLLSRPVFIVLTGAIGLEAGKRIIQGEITLFLAASFLLIAGMTIANLPKKEHADFSWYPDWKMPNRLERAAGLMSLSGLTLLLFTGPVKLRIMAGIVLLITASMVYQQLRKTKRA